MDLWGVKDEEELEALKASWCILEDEQLTSLGLMPLVERAFRGERVVLPDFEYDAGPAFEKAGLPVGGAKKRWVRTHLYPVLDANGEVKHVVDIEEDITEAKAVELRLADYQDRLRALAHDLTLAEERERSHLASALHDGVGQTLALARIQLEIARRQGVGTYLETLLKEVSEAILGASMETRRLISDLSSPSISELGLSAAISDWMAEQIGDRYGITTEIVDELDQPLCEGLSRDDRAILFRNVRELLTNVVKHAQATKVSVLLESPGPNVKITVQDDGVGFDPRKVSGAVTKEGGFGLFSIQERMAELGGFLDLESARGQGCTAVLTMPLTQD
jgi:signal transduction histidine kinase